MTDNSDMNTSTCGLNCECNIHSARLIDKLINWLPFRRCPAPFRPCCSTSDTVSMCVKQIWLRVHLTLTLSLPTPSHFGPIPLSFWNANKLLIRPLDDDGQVKLSVAYRVISEQTHTSLYTCREYILLFRSRQRCLQSVSYICLYNFLISINNQFLILHIANQSFVYSASSWLYRL